LNTEDTEEVEGKAKGKGWNTDWTDLMDLTDTAIARAFD
jgi:hypothetical protein